MTPEACATMAQVLPVILLALVVAGRLSSMRSRTTAAALTAAIVGCTFIEARMIDAVIDGQGVNDAWQLAAKLITFASLTVLISAVGWRLLHPQGAEPRPQPPGD